ncbi:ATP-binding cassette domain-containing protein [Bosea minatitlanensis]|uniref:ATP-binding cassette domain-containing protein n=1 Tax=Bosea minatitlanensis TaxID=128782 RepID=A0ABW0F4Q4_9HYPH|nr:ATP-binding cassette domain-containing protein [Bosea minatitlanensis]MCT4496110.1 ATP-binding cassette domain-containing protein [Bosea minatitlanensis]
MTDASPERSGGARRLWRRAALFAAAALLCGVLLGGLSAWFLGSVALAGLTAAAYSFNFHIPAALVRLFAVGRTAARYGERLSGHHAALSDQTTRRVALFRAMAAAPAVRSAGWQLADQARLADYLDDVEDLDFARLRADLPALLLAAGTAAALVATACIAPLALVPIAAWLAVLAVAARRLARRGALAWEQARALRRDGAQRFGAAMAAVVPLQAEGRWAGHCAEALGRFSRADEAERTLRLSQSGLDALASLLGPLAAVSVFAAAWHGGARAEALLVPAFLAFSWFALAEAAQGASRMVVATLRRRAAQAGIDRWTETRARSAAPARAPARLATLHSAAWQRRAPNGRPLGGPLALALRAGRPTILTGASGIGKTSLLKQIAGWTGQDVLESEAGPLAAADRRAASMFCPHDAAILADTVRANLFAPACPDEELWQALEAVELAERIRAAGGLDGWITQDMLSLGEAQRLNLARAWLSAKPLVLLDEPTEHLRADQGLRILGRLLERLQDRVVVLSSHGVEALPGAETIRL